MYKLYGNQLKTHPPAPVLILESLPQLINSLLYPQIVISLPPKRIKTMGRKRSLLDSSPLAHKQKDAASMYKHKYLDK